MASKATRINLYDTTGSNLIELQNVLGELIVNASNLKLQEAGSDVVLDVSQKILDNESGLSTESTTRAASDVTLQSNIDSEASTRSSAITTLTNDLNAEIANRSAGDATINSTITALDAAYKAADTALQNQITTNTNNITTNTNDISANQAGLNLETTNRTNADNTLQTNIGLEETARIAADNVLTTNLNTEISDRQTEDTNLQNQITNNANSISALSGGSNVNLDSLTELVTNYNNLNHNGISEIAELRAQIDNILSFLNTTHNKDLSTDSYDRVNYTEHVTGITSGSDDRFGYSVAVSTDGLVCYVGAPLYSSSSGIVFCFDKGAGEVWSYAGQVGVGINGEFGNYLATNSDGNWLVVGQHKMPGFAGEVGQALVYRRDNPTTWVQFQTLSIPSGNSLTDPRFSQTVDMDDGALLIIVGCLGSSVVYVRNDLVSSFTSDSGVHTKAWSETKPTASHDSWGKQVACSRSGLYIAISQQRKANSGGNTDAGAVHVYKWGGNSWVALPVIEGDNVDDRIGWNIALSYNTSLDNIVVSFTTRHQVDSNKGRVFTKYYNGTSWVDYGGVISPPFTNYRYGNSDQSNVLRLVQEGAVLVVGNSSLDGDSLDLGMVNVYKLINHQWALCKVIKGSKDSDRLSTFDCNDFLLVAGPTRAGSEPYVKTLKIKELSDKTLV